MPLAGRPGRPAIRESYGRGPGAALGDNPPTCPPTCPQAVRGRGQPRRLPRSWWIRPPEPVSGPGVGPQLDPEAGRVCEPPNLVRTEGQARRGVVGEEQGAVEVDPVGKR